jgi:hypothetical protein
MRFLAGTVLIVGAAVATLSSQGWVPSVPHAWDDEAVRTMELPLTGLGVPAHHVSSEYYYQIPTSRIPKTYPVYAPGREPAGYLEWLKAQEPEDAISFSNLKTQEEWVRAGQLVFDGVFNPSGGPTAERLREFSGSPLYPRPARDGTYPWVRYWVVKKGDVRAFFTKCGSCHTRVLEDGTAVPGAQGNLYEGYWHAAQVQEGATTPEQWRDARRRQYDAPWLSPSPVEPFLKATAAEAAAFERAVIGGVRFRVGTSHLYPPKIPGLIGVADRRYLDATGLVRHRSIGDLMRYAALVDGLESLADFNGFRPFGPLPSPSARTRMSDEALYALALYVYSLQPPANPNRPSDTSRRGEQVFRREGCAACHVPPLYTSNQLTPAIGVEVTAEMRSTDAVLARSVGTDPRLTLRSRKGTGFYRVPSLKGVWYRGPFEHNGSVATLEDWFDPARLSSGFTPTGFRGGGVEHRAVPGHEFGLRLSAEDKLALIAFLKTL